MEIMPITLNTNSLFFHLFPFLLPSPLTLRRGSVSPSPFRHSVTDAFYRRPVGSIREQSAGASRLSLSKISEFTRGSLVYPRNSRCIVLEFVGWRACVNSGRRECFVWIRNFSTRSRFQLICTRISLVYGELGVAGMHARVQKYREWSVRLRGNNFSDLFIKVQCPSNDFLYIDKQSRVRIFNSLVGLEEIVKESCR